jgi:hypothetical protein
MHWPATLAIIIFLAGSALSGLSQSMAELIAFRRQPAARTRALAGAQPPGTPNGR